jgi:hypothetical protein
MKLKHAFRRPRSVHAVADVVQNTPPDVREQRAAVIADFERRRALQAAQQEVDTARAALNRVRDTTSEQAALDAALRRLAEIKSEA